MQKLYTMDNKKLVVVYWKSGSVELATSYYSCINFLRHGNFPMSVSYIMDETRQSIQTYVFDHLIRKVSMQILFKNNTEN